MLSIFSVFNQAARDVDCEPTNDTLDSPDYYKAQRMKRKAPLGKNVAHSTGESIEVHPVVLQCSSDRTLKSFNPIVIERCVKCIDDNDACLPRQNGNLMAKCKSLQQMKMLLIHLLSAMAQSPSRTVARKFSIGGLWAFVGGLTF